MEINLAYIEISNLNKVFRDSAEGKTQALKSVNLRIDKGEFVSIFGPNACGKTTLLNIIADLCDYDEGLIKIDGKEPAKSRIGFVFQNYSESLFPWLKNIDNIGFSLDSSFGSKRQKNKYINEYVKAMGLGELPLDKYPYQCSGGQQQLVSLVRELIYDPDVLLMDEPFASLDYEMRISQQEFLLTSWEKTRYTVIFVSHELDEAIFLADRLILLSTRPGEVYASFDINLKRPRKIEMLEEKMFFDLKIPILQKFREIINK